jgi:group I intron endonuclease
MFCIYLFSDQNGLPIYVGKAKCFKNRISQHYRDRFKYKSWFYNWLNKQIREEIPFYIDILEEVNENNWKEKERYWIKHIKDNGYNLTNMTDGGDGNNNQIFSKETIEKRSEKIRNKPRSKETREAISRKHKGKKLSEETKKKLSEINKGKPCLESTKIKLSKPIKQYTVDGIFIKEFISLTEASKELGCRKSSLTNAINRNKKSTFKGFVWKYN